MSRATITDSETDGMPATPSSAETSPSCITPSPLSDGSSSCSASVRPASRWYCSAWRITPAERIGRPSSVKPGGAGVGQLRHLGELLALLPHGHRGGEAGRDPRLRAGALAQREQDRRRVHHRVGVGHGEDRAEAARGGRAGAGLDVLLVLAPGRAQVHVGVDEAGEGVQALRRRPPRSPSGASSEPGRADLGDRAVAHEQVAGPVEVRARVEQVGAADEQVGRRGPACLSRSERRHAGWGSVVSLSGAAIGEPWPPASSS